MEENKYNHLLNLCEKGEYQEAKKLLNPLNINGIYKFYTLKQTPLLSALEGKNIDLIKYILENGAEINKLVRTIYGFVAPLHFLITIEGEEFYNEFEPEDSKTVDDYSFLPGDRLVKLLIDYKADINLEDGYMNTPLDYSLYNNHIHAERLLIKFGAKRRIQIKNEYFSFIHNCRNYGLEAVKRSYKKEFINGLRAELQLELIPIIASLQNKNIEISKFLIEQGSDLNKISIWEFGPLAPLHFAIAYEAEQIRLLSINRSTHNYNKIFEVLKLLIDSGAEINKIDGEGRTPLDWAVITKQVTVESFLLKYGAKMAREL